MEINIRKIRWADMFTLSEIIDKMGITEEVAKLSKKAQGGTDSDADASTQLVVLLVSKLHLAKKEIGNMVADFTGLTAKEVEELGIAEIKEVIVKIIKGVSWGDVFPSGTTE